MKRILLSLVVAVVAGACSDGPSDQATLRADSMTQRQRDSVIGASRLPGAQGVRGALEASDAAAARAAAADSIRPD
jgi:hypothetical protein